MENFHCGERFKELCTINRKESASYWTGVLGLTDRTLVYHRWKSEKIDAREIILICAELNMSVQEFFGLQTNSDIVQDESNTYKKVYIEDQIDNLRLRMLSVESKLKEINEANN